MLRCSTRFSRCVTTMTRIPPKDPLIVIVGSTGTGKSKLAVSLATQYNGEIINADAVQMYRGLPIVTNKIPEHERNGIPHHLIDRISLSENPWTVHQFVDESSKIIEDIRARGKLPIVVGGTNYYVFSLIFKDSVLSESDGEDDSEVSGPRLESTLRDLAKVSDLSILDQPTDVVLAKLRELDPVMADSWHPNDRRKIQRSLEICLKTGRKASEIYEEQKSIKGHNASKVDVPPLRYEPLIFWMDAEDAILKDRLNVRVDAMVQDGLFEEVKEMRAFANDSCGRGVMVDRSKGVWVAIGYKELEPWLNASENNSCDEKTIPALRNTGVENIKAATRRYAKQQHRWIRIRLAEHLKAADVLERLYLLDGSDLNAWEAMVAGPSERITSKYLSGLPLPESSSLSQLAFHTFENMQKQDKISDRQVRVCDTCQKTLMTDQEWTKHVKSNRHKKILEGIRKRAQHASHGSNTSQRVGTTASV